MAEPPSLFAGITRKYPSLHKLWAQMLQIGGTARWSLIGSGRLHTKMAVRYFVTGLKTYCRGTAESDNRNAFEAKGMGCSISDPRPVGKAAPSDGGPVRRRRWPTSCATATKRNDCASTCGHTGGRTKMVLRAEAAGSRSETSASTRYRYSLRRAGSLHCFALSHRQS